MPKKTDKTIVLLNFNDPTNLYKDECGGKWNANKNPKLIWSNYVNKYVLQTSQDTIEHLLLENGLELGGEDFTIDGLVYIGTQSTVNYNRIFEFTIEDRWGRFELCLYDGTYKLYIYSESLLKKDISHITSNTEFKDKWANFLIRYNYSLKKIEFFINYDLIGYRDDIQFDKINFKYVSLANATFHNYDQDHNLNGYFSYFRITNELLDPTTMYGFTIEL